MEKTKKLEEYREYLFQNELSEGTIKIYVRQAEKLLEYFNKDEITKTKMIVYKKQLQGQNYSELSFLTVESLKEGQFTVNNKGKIREVYLTVLCLLAENLMLQIILVLFRMKHLDHPFM